MPQRYVHPKKPKIDTLWVEEDVSTYAEGYISFEISFEIKERNGNILNQKQ